jgi:hypothetical protein
LFCGAAPRPAGRGGRGAHLDGKTYVLTDQGWVLATSALTISEEPNDSVKIVFTDSGDSGSGELVRKIRDLENLAGRNIYDYLSDNQVIQIPQPAEGTVPMSKTATFSSEAVAFPADESATSTTNMHDSAFVADDADVYLSLDNWVDVIQTAEGFSSDGKVKNIDGIEIGTWQKIILHQIEAIDIEITNTAVYSGVAGTCGSGGGSSCNRPLTSDDYLALFSDGRAVVVHHEETDTLSSSRVSYYFNQTAVSEIIQSFDLSDGNYWDFRQENE